MPDLSPSETVAVLGPGAVGGMLAVRLALAGVPVICVATPGTAAAIRAHGLTLAAPDGTFTAHPGAAGELVERVSLLLVTVKAPALANALERIASSAVADAVVVPLLNGLEHPELIRRRLGARVAPGSIARFEAFREQPTRVVQTTAAPIVTLASHDVDREELEATARPLRAAGIEVEIGDDERTVLWEKLARLGPFAAVTALTQCPVGELRADPQWRATLAAAIDEACEVASADGVLTPPAAQWEMIDAMAPTLTTSTARDVAAGRPSELDAIAGAVVRAGRRLGVPTPTLESLLTRLGEPWRAP